MKWQSTLQQQAPSILHSLESIPLASHAARDLSVVDGVMSLRRAWPRGSDQLHLEYALADGSLIAGQWFADASRACAVYEKTCRAALAKPTCALINDHVLLQAHGVDRRLVNLQSWVGRPEVELISHRPERRAVLRLREHGLISQYVKIVRPDRAADLVARHRLICDAPWQQVRVPNVRIDDDQAGVVMVEPLIGECLDDLRGIERWFEVTPAYASALRSLHELAAPGSDGHSVGVHTSSEEIRVVKKWLDDAAVFFPAFANFLAPLAQETIRQLEALPPSPCHTLIHRDFYEKQAILCKDGRLGLLDFDTLTVGDPAVDVGNAIAHLHWRDYWSGEAIGEAVAEAFLEHYNPDAFLRRRLPAFTRASKLRLTCVHAFRPPFAGSSTLERWVSTI